MSEQIASPKMLPMGHSFPSDGVAIIPLNDVIHELWIGLWTNLEAARFTASK